MQNSQAYYQALLSDFILDRLSPEKADELYAFIRRCPEDYERLMGDPAITGLIQESAESSSLSLLPEADIHIRERLENYIQHERPAALPPGRSYRVGRWAAAAVIVIGIGMAGVWLASRTKQQPAIAPGSTVESDIAAPTASHASIRLSNGKTIYLDSAVNGELATQGNTAIIKNANGQLVYKNAAGQEIMNTEMNTLTNPRGSRIIDIALSDGTRVWLNAGSSLTYPVVFTGNERRVAISGEAYFEVTHNAAKPFYVGKGNVEVKVLGTHFDVNAYDDEKYLRITLLEGSVAVRNGDQHIIIKPGEQAVAGEESLSTDRNADIAAVMAWKNNLFDFNRLPLEEIMRQLSRWYDIDVAYKGDIKSREFGGEIQRDLNLSEVLNGLKATGIRYTLEGKKLIIQE